MKGFVLACGHSGTTWSASALIRATDLVARHESWRYSIGKDFGGVESNGNLWKMTAELSEAFPKAEIVHQVRDGKKVVRTIMYSKNRDFFEAACRRWTGRNERLLVDLCTRNRFRLEDLTTNFSAFRAFAERLGAKVVDREAWDSIRVVRVNASPAAKTRRFPAYADWTDAEKEIFRKVCGPLMKELKYSR